MLTESYLHHDLTLITALTISCLAGCGNSKSTEKETASEAGVQQTEENSTETENSESEGEEKTTTDEAELPEMELGTVTITDVVSGKNVDITYNATIMGALLL